VLSKQGLPLQLPTSIHRLPEVIGIAAIDEGKHHARFSQHNPGKCRYVQAQAALLDHIYIAIPSHFPVKSPPNHSTTESIKPPDVELAAGGVLALSTLRASDYNHRIIDEANANDSAVVILLPQNSSSSSGGGEEEPLHSPGPTAFEGSGLTEAGGLMAAVVDCGAAEGPCKGAAGKVCVVMRENHTDSGQWLCSKVGGCGWLPGWFLQDSAATCAFNHTAFITTDPNQIAHRRSSTASRVAA